MRFALLLLTVFVAGCSAKADGPPEIIADRTACAHCTMFVSEPRFAAAYETRGGEARVFDDIGCLLNAAAAEPSVSELRFWFHDMTNGGWIRGEESAFVKTKELKTPMSGGIVAYRDRQEAERAARAQTGLVIGSLSELLALARQEGQK